MAGAAVPMKHTVLFPIQINPSSNPKSIYILPSDTLASDTLDDTATLDNDNQVIQSIEPFLRKRK